MHSSDPDQQFENMPRIAGPGVRCGIQRRPTRLHLMIILAVLVVSRFLGFLFTLSGFRLCFFCFGRSRARSSRLRFFELMRVIGVLVCFGRRSKFYGRILLFRGPTRLIDLRTSGLLLGLGFEKVEVR